MEEGRGAPHMEFPWLGKGSEGWIKCTVRVQFYEYD